MSIVQTEYTNFLGEYVSGQVADTQTCDIDSLYLRGSDSVPYGYAVGPYTGTGGGDRDIQLGAGRPLLALLNESGFDNSETDLTYDNAERAIRVGEYILVESEIMRVASLTATVLTIERGVLGSTAAAHDDDSEIYAFDETTFRGVAIMDERLPASNGVMFETGDTVPVLHRGDVAVTVSAAVSADDQVVVTTTGTTGDPAGSFSSRTPDATHVVVPGARFLTSAAANEIAEVRFGTANPTSA